MLVNFTGEAGKIVLRAKPLSGKLRIEVEDTGLGIPKDLHNRIFESFFSSRSG